MLIISNNFPYRRWNIQRVSSHLMVIPKRHLLTLAEMTAEERDDMMRVVTEYETNGYSFYIRSHSDKTRTVGHVHGHLFAFKS